MIAGIISEITTEKFLTAFRKPEENDMSSEKQKIAAPVAVFFWGKSPRILFAQNVLINSINITAVQKDPRNGQKRLRRNLETFT